MTNFRLFQTERICKLTILNLMKWWKVLQKGTKLYKKQKLPVKSNFYYSYIVFKRLPLQTRKNVWEGLNYKNIWSRIVDFYLHPTSLYNDIHCLFDSPSSQVSRKTISPFPTMFQ